jgi:hypothetical protein
MGLLTAGSNLPASIAMIAMTMSRSLSAKAASEEAGTSDRYVENLQFADMAKPSRRRRGRAIFFL